MSEAKDPAIKLFGMTIPLSEIPPDNESNGAATSTASADASRANDDSSLDHDRGSSSMEADTIAECENHEEGDDVKDAEEGKSVECKKEEDENMRESEAAPVNEDDMSSQDAEKENAKDSMSEEHQNEANNSTEKALKKPDKILSCPRCNSMDTKFCYYNNYNVNQPRHFCKNCQRYWTAGGTMRNVPVGAGRRKNKSTATHYRHISVPESLHSLRSDSPKANGTVLTFGSEVPLHESMATVLTIADKSKLEETETGASVKDETTKEAVPQNFPGLLPRIPWPYQMVPPGFYLPGIAVPVFPGPPYWGCAMPWPAPPWHAPPVSPTPSVGSTGPISPTLGKHSRDENSQKSSGRDDDDVQKENAAERCLWIPKTLRIDDPEEAAKSSIWTTLGIKHDKPDLIGGRALFKSFKSKGDEKSHSTETSPVLQANPAALSRSVNFHERS